ncbi:hypothetical protein [Endozoicomonas sp. ALD040]|uniref:hypothetical protein n=1 Tax=Endozoicomonas sp. ALD040 TaxID=3403079 RepID=UPI003BB1B06B
MRLHNYKTFFYCLLLLILSAQSFAEENTQGNAFENLVYFQPRIYIAEKAQPCIGVRVSKKHIFTSPSCAKQILALFMQAVDINVLSPGSVKLGHIQTSHNRSATAGLLSIDLYADNLPYQPPVLSTVNVTNGIELTAYYMQQGDEEMNVTKHYFIFDSQQNSGVQTMIKLPSDISIPDGAPVRLRNQLFCVVVSDTCIRSSYLLNASAKDYDPGCPRANDTYYFHCRERGMYNCSEVISPEGVAGLDVNGSCVNPKSKEQCTFNSSYAFNSDEMDYERKGDFITCKSCSAQYTWSNSSLTGSKSVICRPKGCMPGCKGKPDPKHSGKKPADSIGEGVAGEVAAFVLIGVIASVGYLIYKLYHRANYQSL